MVPRTVIHRRFTVDRFNQISHSVFVDTTGFYPLYQKIPNTRLTPESIVGKHRGKKGIYYDCQCACGNRCIVSPGDVKRGRTKSCGCFKRDCAKNNKIHGLSKTPEYAAARNAWDRCFNKKNKYFRTYGARGISVKFKSPEAFAGWLMSHLPKPSGKFWLDRKDNNGSYEPNNLRWSTPKESGRNHRGNRLITIDGVTHNLSEWSEISGVGTMTIHGRIKAKFPESLWLHNGKITKALLFTVLNSNRSMG